MGLTDWRARRRARRVANTVTSKIEDYPPAPPPPPPPRRERITGSPPLDPETTRMQLRSMQRRAELADQVAERAIARARIAEAEAADWHAATTELESRHQQLDARAARLRGVVERVVNDPTSDRGRVQGVLLTALQNFDSGKV